MHFRLIEARQIQGFVLWLKFSDGVEGEIDLRDELDGPVFEPLKNVDVFKQFRIDPALVWPNGADFATEFLHDNVRGPPNLPPALAQASNLILHAHSSRPSRYGTQRSLHVCEAHLAPRNSNNGS